MHFPSATIRIQAAGVAAQLERISVRPHREFWGFAQQQGLWPDKGEAMCEVQCLPAPGPNGLRSSWNTKKVCD